MPADLLALTDIDGTTGTKFFYLLCRAITDLPDDEWAALFGARAELQE